MIDRIVDYSVRHRAFVLIATALLCLAGWFSMRRVSVDALPDLSETQVIVYSKWDRSPDIIENQVTYPIISALNGAPKVKTVRGISDFGYSYVYVVFEDKTDPYWARSRTMEYLAGVLSELPKGVKTTLGPDATGLGWIFQYVLVDDSGKHSLAELRSVQDWYLRYHLKSVRGVSEVAAVGGFGKQYQVNVDPQRLQQFGVGMKQVTDAVRGGNEETGARLLDFGGAEYMVRGLGYSRSPEEIGNSVVTATSDGIPVRVRDVGDVVAGPDLRRGITDWNGDGEAVSGIVVMRIGENALQVIERVKTRLRETAPGLPAGVHVVPVYDRSLFIRQTISDTKWTILQIMLTVSVVIFLFLRHVPSALIPAITIPVTVLVAFLPFGMMGLNANIMSLGGIAIATGALVDAAIVVVEQTHKRLEEWEASGRRGNYTAVVVSAVKEVAGPSFFSLLVIGVSFLPVLALEGMEGRLFKPLAYTKTLAMLAAAFLAITFDPALRLTLIRVSRFRLRPSWLARGLDFLLVGKIQRENDHPASRLLLRLYEPVVRWSLHRPFLIFGLAAIIVLSTIPVFLRLGSEFMPPVAEGTLLYMPTTMPGISIAEAGRLVQATDQILRSFPEVDGVLGKAGRADTPTDPAPLSMLETVITLRSKSEWRRVPTWYSGWAPESLKPFLRHIASDTISEEKLVSEMNQALQIPGVTNAWTMPIRGRIDMLTTGIRTPLGIKIQGAEPERIQQLSTEVADVLKSVPGARSVFAERPADGFFVDVDWSREKLARYGLTIQQAQQTLSSSVGGDNVTTTIEGRARYPVNVRYLRDFRSDLPALNHVLLPIEEGKHYIPLSEVATLRTATGPSMLRDEDGLITGYVYVDLAGRDIGTYVEAAKHALSKTVAIPPGYSLRWAGQYESMQSVRETLRVVIPITLFLVAALLWLNTRSFAKSAIVLLAIPFSAAGAVWMLFALGYNLSVAAWVGVIALLGVDAETGVFMLLYLDLSYESALKNGSMKTKGDLQNAILAGAARRIRPKFMTVASMLFGLLPVLWSTGTGSEVMKRVAAPMVGGLATSFLLELLVYPVIYQLWRGGQMRKRQTQAAPTAAEYTSDLAISR